MFRNDTQAMEELRDKLARLNMALATALRGAIDPDWKRNERDLLKEAHEAQSLEKKK